MLRNIVKEESQSLEERQAHARIVVSRVIMFSFAVMCIFLLRAVMIGA